MKEEASGFYDIEEIRANIKNKELADIDIFIYEKTNSTNTRARLFAKENENISLFMNNWKKILNTARDLN